MIKSMTRSSVLTRTDYRSMLAGNAAAFFSDYELISTASVGGSNAATFTSIPSTYKHLQIRYTGRGSSNIQQVNVQFNGDTASNYSFHGIEAYTNGTPGAFGYANQQYILAGYLTSSTAAANAFGAGIVDVLDYASTNKYKTVRGFSQYVNSGSDNSIQVNSGNWRSTSAITSLTLYLTGGAQNWVTGSRVSLYGIKG